MDVQHVAAIRPIIAFIGALLLLTGGLRTFRMFRGPGSNPHDSLLHEALEDTSNTEIRVYGFSLSVFATLHPDSGWTSIIVSGCAIVFVGSWIQRRALVSLYHFDKFVRDNSALLLTEAQFLERFVKLHPKNGRWAKWALKVRNGQKKRLAVKELSWYTRLLKDR